MPRQARLDVPGALHHIMVRGINKSAIFEDEQDRARFLERLGQRVTEARASVYAWVIMDTHSISFLRAVRRASRQSCESSLPGTLNTITVATVAQGIYLENRYKSILCDEDHYLLSLIRYIHLNPVRAGIITTLTELDSYPWSGHSTIMEKTRHDWMDTAFVLTQLANRKKTARNAYGSFVEKEWP